jgi:hypothetical protein
MSPFWQLKQTITIDGNCYIDHNLAFGSSGSPGIFISFNSLVAWIAKHIKGIEYISRYVDDSSGCNLFGNVAHYYPYDANLLSDQFKLLLLWDKLSISYKHHKQVHGSPLTIIGIQVDPNAMELTLPNASKTQLLNKLKL